MREVAFDFFHFQNFIHSSKNSIFSYVFVPAVLFLWTLRCKIENPVFPFLLKISRDPLVELLQDSLTINFLKAVVLYECLSFSNGFFYILLATCSRLRPLELHKYFFSYLNYFRVLIKLSIKDNIKLEGSRGAAAQSVTVKLTGD